jgi:hypothetical protein
MAPDVIGYVASSLVFAAYCTKEMISLRIIAIGSNVAFIAYGLSLGLAPVWALHAALLPLNGWRLAQAIACKPKAGMTEPGGGQRHRHHCITPGPSMEFGILQKSSQPDQADFCKSSLDAPDNVRRKAS